MASSNVRKSSLQPALHVLLRGRRIFLNRLLAPRDDEERVSGDAEPRPLLVSLPAGTAAAAAPESTTTTSSVELLANRHTDDGGEDDSSVGKGRGGTVPPPPVRLGLGDGGGLDTVAAAPGDVGELGDKEFDVGGQSGTSSAEPSRVVHERHWRTSRPATRSATSRAPP